MLGILILPVKDLNRVEIGYVIFYQLNEWLPKIHPN